MNKAVKIVLTILNLGVLTFLSLFSIFIFGFGGEGFYIILTMVVYFLMGTLIPLSIFGVVRGKRAWLLWGGLLAGIILASAVRESVRAYHNSFERFDEYRVDLTAYMPFAADTKAARTDQPSTLRLTDSLPRLDGATALYPIYAAFAQAVYPEKEYDPWRDSEVMCSTTADAYEALVEGRADIIFVLQPSEEQLQYAETGGVEMVFTPIGREAFVFFVNAKNPVSGLSVGLLQDIYSGRITNWQEVGGKNWKIRAFQRETGSGSQTAFLEFMQGSEIMEPPQNDVVHGMGGIIERTASYANYPNAIGYTFRFYAESMVGNDGIKLLAIEGIYPERETIGSGQYPLTSYFYAVTRASETNPNVARVIEWICSDQGQELVEKTGYNPLL